MGFAKFLQKIVSKALNFGSFRDYSFCVKVRGFRTKVRGFRTKVRGFRTKVRGLKFDILTLKWLNIKCFFDIIKRIEND